jgi:sugar O-acyltransferase (sialic acid O-acetyltransferase NeuD family)
MKTVIFWGATGQALVLHELVSQLGYALVALFDNDPTVRSLFPGVPIYHGRAGFQSWREERPGDESRCLVAIGGANGRDRLAIQQYLESNGIQPIVAVHPTAFVAESARLGKGSQILAHASVCAAATLGDACIVNTKANVDHECVLGKGVHVAPGATLAGRVVVGDHTMIGSGAVVLPTIHVGSDVIVGAGAVVTRDVPDGKVIYGNPARVKGENAPRSI